MILRLFRFKNSNMPTREKIKGTRSEPTLARFSCAKEEDKKTGKQESRNFRYWWIQIPQIILRYLPIHLPTAQREENIVWATSIALKSVIRNISPSCLMPCTVPAGATRQVQSVWKSVCVSLEVTDETVPRRACRYGRCITVDREWSCWVLEWTWPGVS